MKFWDSSAIVPLLVRESSSAEMMSFYERDPELLVWWGAEVECVSALARLEREGGLAGPSTTRALDRLDALALAWREIQPVPRVRTGAVRLLRVHDLRAADALQLAAALVAAEDHPKTLPVVTLDHRLGLAAEREGFPVIGPGQTLNDRTARDQRPVAQWWPSVPARRTRSSAQRKNARPP